MTQDSDVFPELGEEGGIASRDPSHAATAHRADGGAHTPGPLVLQPNGANGFNIGVEHLVRGGFTTFIRLGGSVAHRSPISLAGRAPIETEEALANGRLWAAAPCLLKAAGEAETALVFLANHFDLADLTPLAENAISEVRRAIAKATPPQPRDQPTPHPFREDKPDV